MAHRVELIKLHWHAIKGIYTSSLLHTRAVGKYHFSGLLRHIRKKYCSAIHFFNTSLLENILGLGIQV